MKYIFKLLFFCFSLESKMKKSQLGQDIVALTINKSKRKGFFVEFAATNGFDFNNTYFLEKKF